MELEAAYEAINSKPLFNVVIKIKVNLTEHCVALLFVCVFMYLKYYYPVFLLRKEPKAAYNNERQHLRIKP